ncbi:MAG: 4Fe-4S binding protein [Bacteroidaceae bacterium]|nr:4Fe-4S binding protein [Bacteroidaceae bacterium]
MAKFKGAIVVDTERCKGCNLCVVACPFDLLELTHTEVNTKGYHFSQQVIQDKCTGCTACAVVCPDGCISVFRTKED